MPSHSISERPLVTRRDVLCVSGMGLAASLVGPKIQAAVEPAGESPFRYCLNTSTVQGQKLSLVDEVDLAAKAGYDGIEPWIREIEQFKESGGQLRDLQQRIADSGLTVESAIGFANWIVDDDAARQAGLEQAKRDMELVRAIGGSRIAAPPVGANRSEAAPIDLLVVAERYRALLDAGHDIGVVPQVEIWGSSRNLSRLGEAVMVAVESGHRDACILPDIYHIHRGGSDFAGLKLLSGQAVHCFHMNDYPASDDRTRLTDADRVYPGDGVAPLTEILRMLRASGFRGALSLELFNRDYWQQPADVVARTGLERMQAAAARV